MAVGRLSRGLMATGVVLLAVSAGLMLAGASIDQAAGQALGAQAGSAELAPGLGGAAPGSDAGATAAAAAGDGLPFTGIAALPVAIAGALLLVGGIATRRFAESH